MRRIVRLFLAPRGIAMKIGLGVAKRGLAQTHKALHIPALQYGLVGVDIDGKVEKVGDEGRLFALLRGAIGLQDVQALDDQNVGTIDLDAFSGNNVVDKMA